MDLNSVCSEAIGLCGGVDIEFKRLRVKVTPVYVNKQIHQISDSATGKVKNIATVSFLALLKGKTGEKVGEVLDSFQIGEMEIEKGQVTFTFSQPLCDSLKETNVNEFCIKNSEGVFEIKEKQKPIIKTYGSEEYKELRYDVHRLLLWRGILPSHFCLSFPQFESKKKIVKISPSNPSCPEFLVSGTNSKLKICTPIREKLVTMLPLNIGEFPAVGTTYIPVYVKKRTLVAERVNNDSDGHMNVANVAPIDTLNDKNEKVRKIVDSERFGFVAFENRQAAILIITKKMHELFMKIKIMAFNLKTSNGLGVITIKQYIKTFNSETAYKTSALPYLKD